MRYRMITENDSTSFSAAVNEALRGGWNLRGDFKVVLDYGRCKATFFQAVTLMEATK